MATKYKGLPDIDTAPDVFETADEPDIPLRPNNDGAGDDEPQLKAVSEDIDARGLPDRRRAERAFGRARRKDGSYQLGLPPLIGVASSSDEGPSRPKETPAARIRRLKTELAEVEKEVASAPLETSGSGVIAGRPNRPSVLPPRPAVDLPGEILRLQQRISILEVQEDDKPEIIARDVWRHRLVGFPPDDPGRAAESVLEHNAISVQSAGELDKRLASLEALVGPAGDGIENSTPAPLLSSLSRFEHLLSLLTQPRHLDAISRRIKLLLVDLDRAAAASRRAGVSIGAAATQTDDKSPNITLSAAEYAQLETVFALLPRLDALMPVVPPVLARLQSLASLHADAAGLADRLARMEAEDVRGRDEIIELGGLVKAVQDGMEESATTVLKNWETIEGRIKALDERVAKLQ